MGIQNLRRKTLEWTLAGLITCQVAVPVAGSVGATAYFSQEPAPVQYVVSNSQLSARNYLDLANSVAHQNDVDDTYRCKELVRETFDAYKAMLERVGRDDLAKEVRIAADFLSQEKHTWLQIREDDVWVDYETLQEPPNLNVENVQSYSEQTKQERMTFEEPVVISHVSIPGTKILVPTLQSFGDRGSLWRHARFLFGG